MENKFDEVVEKLRFLDGVTKKSAKRMAIDLVNKNNKIENAQEALDIIKNDLGQCPTCFYMTIDNVCPICSDPDRDKNLIAVVSTMSDAMTIEEIHDYNGAYAVLNGEINLSKNITPDKLTIDKLFNRTNKNTELILALNSTFNGELTANYIRDIARQRGIKYTRLARGIPVGGVLDYVDEKTLSDALKNRKKDD
ncbi:recombination mediator RecR [Mesoplasma lactucae]|uniref:Recombination protein RecR n=1 Tax=Mesoplasma lactucae ATCC 49193 TaxID=81460 RepID=A0A291IRY7_9MOLU|nr:recombination mediator RecR [Mesoplasma lactucae]ATG97695.1 recombination protein RecR [Mesoplasma lactucae ATCC 49193]ATZ19839.1 recombination protein RecR [Mesoplasma lactucae ATCC 49193]MCL8216702.1 Recombination protein RecR [Mesoplasma lactucae ATCC 49193]